MNPYADNIHLQDQVADEEAGNSFLMYCYHCQCFHWYTVIDLEFASDGEEYVACKHCSKNFWCNDSWDIMEAKGWLI